MSLHRFRLKFPETANEKGLYADGGNLYLQVGEGGSSKSWVFRYQVPGDKQRRIRQMGLGSLHTVSLTEAREAARLYRQQLHQGLDPIEARDESKLNKQLERAKLVTFEQCTEGWLAATAPLRAPRRTVQIRRRLEMYAYPTLRDLPIQKLDMSDRTGNAVDLVYKVLVPLWHTKTKTGQDVQLFIENILKWARASNYIHGDNAASMDGPLGIKLPKISTFYRGKHYNALPYQEVGTFMAKLRAMGEPAIPATPPERTCYVCDGPDAQAIAAARRNGAASDKLAQRFRIPKNTMKHHLVHVGMPFRRSVAAYCLEFLILTAVRKGMAISARWDEIDEGRGLWKCSQHKTEKKTDEPYVVALSKTARDILTTMRDRQEAVNLDGKIGEFVFPGIGGRTVGHLTQSNLDWLMTTLGYGEYTVHGFRTAFGSWAAETGQDETAREKALGHLVGNQVARIYTRQAENLEPLRQIMEAWAAHCGRTEPLSAEVIPIRQAK